MKGTYIHLKEKLKLTSQGGRGLVEKKRDNNGGYAFPAPPFSVVINVVSYSVFGSDDCLLEEDS